MVSHTPCMDEKATRMVIVSICNRCNSCDVGLPLLRLSTTLLLGCHCSGSLVYHVAVGLPLLRLSTTLMLGYHNPSYFGVALPKLLIHTVLGYHDLGTYRDVGLPQLLS